jgi:hypothetical protein
MSVRDVNCWPDFCGPKVSGSALSALGDVQVALLALIAAQHADGLRMHAGTGWPSGATSLDLAHIGDDRSIHIGLRSSAAFVVVHLFCVARGMFFAPGTLVGAGGVSTYLSGAFILMSRHRSRDDARRRREGQATATVKEKATGRLLQK